MSVRKLLGVLTLLLFVAPLGASLCSHCVPGQCTMTMDMPEVSEPAEPQSAKTQDLPPCHAAMEPVPEEPLAEESLAGETASGCSGPSSACHGDELAMASSGCCSMTAASETRETVTPAVSVSFEMALSETPHVELDSDDHPPVDDRRRLAPRQAYPPLFTLHSAFLI